MNKAKQMQQLQRSKIHTVKDTSPAANAVMKIRKGTADDIPACIMMGRRFYLETEYRKHVDFCETSCETLFDMALRDQLFAVLTADGVPVGFILGLKSPFLFNHNYDAGAEIAWWIDPPFRGTKKSIDLLQFMEKLAEKAGLKFWSMMYLQCSQPEKLKGIYERNGYRLTETAYLTVLNPDQDRGQT